MKDSLDYASLDQGDEVALNRLVQEQLGRGQKRRRAALPPNRPVAPPQLPLGELGSGQQIANQLLAIAKKCGEDKKCWQSELLAMKQNRSSA